MRPQARKRSDSVWALPFGADRVAGFYPTPLLGQGSSAVSLGGTRERWAISLLTPDRTYELDSVVWWFFNPLSATGDVIARLYAMSGDFGTTPLPSGAALASSERYDVSNVPPVFAPRRRHIRFEGANRIELAANTHYMLAIEEADADVSAQLFVFSRRDNDYPGAAAEFTSAGQVWQTPATQEDIGFLVLGLERP